MTTRDPITIVGNRLRKLPAGDFLGDGKGSLGAMHSIGAVSTDFEFDFTGNGARQSVALSADASYHITAQNLPGNGLHQVCIHNVAGVTITPTWSDRFDFGTIGPPVIPDDVVCVITGLWDSVGVSLHCVHNCPAPRVLQGSIGATFDVGPTLGNFYSPPVRVPYDGSIVLAEVIAGPAQSGNAVIEVYRSSYAGWSGLTSITGSAPLNLSLSTKFQDSTLAGWTADVAAGDYLIFELISSAALTSVSAMLTLERT